MKKKHIVIIQYTTLAENYGLSTYLRNTLNFLAKRKDIKVSAIILKGNLNKENCPKNIDLYEVPGSTYSLKNNFKFVFSCYWILKKINKANKIDTIHCLYPNSSVASSVLFKLFVSKINLVYDLRSPWLHVSVERGSINKAFVPLYLFAGYFIERVLSYFVDKHIFITDGLYNFYKKKVYLGNKPVTVIPSGIDTEMFALKANPHIRNKYKIKNDEFLLGYGGAVSLMRDLDEVLIALSKVNKKRKIKFMIVGDGDALDLLKNKARQLKLEDKVIITGRVPFSEMPRYINSFDAGICHLRDTFVFRQSYPMKILEYLAAGLPVLTNDLPAHKEIQKAFRSEVKIYKDTKGLTEIINGLERKPKKDSTNISNYDWKNITEQISSFY